MVVWIGLIFMVGERGVGRKVDCYEGTGEDVRWEANSIAKYLPIPVYPVYVHMASVWERIVPDQWANWSMKPHALFIFLSVQISIPENIFPLVFHVPLYTQRNVKSGAEFVGGHCKTHLIAIAMETWFEFKRNKYALFIIFIDSLILPPRPVNRNTL